MKRFISVFLCLILCFSIVVPASAVGLDSSSDGYSFDAFPYLEEDYYNTSSLSSGDTLGLNLVFDENVQVGTVDFIIQTDDIGASFSYGNNSFSKLSLGGNLYRVYGTVGGSVYSSYQLVYTKSSGSWLRIKTMNVIPSNNITFSVPFTVDISGSYTYRNYNDDGSFTTVSASISENYTGSAGTNINSPILHSHTGSILGGTVPVNEQTVLLTTYIRFDWKAYDKVDIYLFNSFDSIVDYAFYINSVNVLSDIQSVVLNNQEGTIITLDFTELNRSQLGDTCNIRIRGYDKLSSDSTSQLFRIFNLIGFTKQVSTNFWPSWLQKIIDKLDAMITGRGEDQTAADSFQDTVDEQASQFEDMSNTMNQVERPDIESIDLSTSNMVDTDSVILATNGIGTILENPIILKVIIMALTLALAGFVLYGKR